MGSWRTLLVAPSLVLCLGAIVACGSSSSSSTPSSTSTSSASSSSTSGANSAVAKLVPAAIKSKGTLSVATDASYAPMEFFATDGKTIIGADADLVKALGAVMGLKTTLVNAPFPSIVPGLAAAKWDYSASSFTDNKEREKTVDFVDYANVGESFYTKAVGGTSIGSINDICGKSVSVEAGTIEESDAKTQSSKCTKEGKAAVNVQVFQDQNSANLAVSSGRAQLGFADTPVADYQVKKTGGEFKIVGAAYGVAPYGIAIPKTPGLAPAILAALKVLAQNGTYASIFKNWDLQSIAIPASAMKINGATS